MVSDVASAIIDSGIVKVIVNSPDPVIVRFVNIAMPLLPITAVPPSSSPFPASMDAMISKSPSPKRSERKVLPF